PSLQGGDLDRTRSDPHDELLTWVSAGGRVRAVTMTFQPSPDEDVPGAADVHINLPQTTIRLALARSRADIDALLGRLRRLLAVVGAFTAVATGLVLAAVIRSRMTPLDRLANEISSLNAAGLSSRISLASTPREIAPVVERLNHLLDSLEDAVH